MFGSGFAIALMAVLVTGWSAGLLLRWHIPTQMSSPVIPTAPSSSATVKQSNPGVQFHELSLEEQIKKASVIALARHERWPDGKQKTIIKEFLKKEPNTTIYYNIGDEYPNGSFFKDEGIHYGDGLIVFFVGSPASMRMSMTFSGDRIHGLGDIPLQLLREKCEGGG